MTAPGGGNFIQLFGLLANLSQQRKAQDLDERRFTQTQTQFKELVKQYEEQHGDKRFTEGMLMLSKATPETFAALSTVVESRVGQQNPELIKPLLEAFAKAPTMMGLEGMSTDQRAATYREAASQATAGMPTSGVAQSQLGSALASGGPPPGDFAQLFGQPAQQMQVPGVAPGSPSIPVNVPSGQDQWQGLQRNFLARTAQGYTPEQYGLQRGQLELGWENLRQSERSLLANAGVGDVQAMIEDAKRGSLTPAQKADALRGIGSIINDMNAAKADKEGNMGRQRSIGMLSILLGLPANYFVPQPGAPNSPPTSSTPFRQYFQGQFGAPGMSPSTPYIPFPQRP